MMTNWHDKMDMEKEARFAFNIGDRHEFACDLVKAHWYWTVDRKWYHGPYRTKSEARRYFRIHLVKEA
jgi:hypothetical protein